MKRLFIIAVAISFLQACSSQNDAKTQNATTSAQIHEVLDCSVALNFINDYVALLLRQSPSNFERNWMERNLMLTDNFKAAYNKLIDDAFEADPELGLDFDPILDAQDFPDKGFELVSCDSKTGYVTVKGKDWPAFILVLKVIPHGDKWHVDGAGVINVPPERRAKR